LENLHLLATLDPIQKFLYLFLAFSLVATLIARGLKLSKTHWFRDYSESFLWAISVAMIIRVLAVDNFSIPSESMVDTLRVDDRLFVNKAVYGYHVPFTQGRMLAWRKPHRGEIVIFIPPIRTLQPFVKRCIALPGDVVEVRAKQVFINGQPGDWPAAHGLYPTFPKGVPQPEMYAPGNPLYQADRFASPLPPSPAWNRDWYGPVTLAAGCYWMMGDNRDNSFDSRFFGPVREEALRGTPLLRYWPLDRFGLPR
jgi:signal peptidase I